MIKREDTYVPLCSLTRELLLLSKWSSNYAHKIASFEILCRNIVKTKQNAAHVEKK